MALKTTKVSSSTFVTQRTSTSRPHRAKFSSAKTLQQSRLHSLNQGVELWQLSTAHLLAAKSGCAENLWGVHRQPVSLVVSRRFSTLCRSRTPGTEEERVRPYGDSSAASSSQSREEEVGCSVVPGTIIHPNLADACKFVHNDAKYVNERARNDIILLSREIMRLDARVRRDVAILGSGFLKLDARAREDTEKIDRNMKRKAERLHYIATRIKDRAESKLKTAADKHWSDGALVDDLLRADVKAKQRATEDALMALEFVKDIHDLMVSKMYKFPLLRDKGSPSTNGMLGRIMLEKNGKTLDFFPGEISADRISAIQEVYWSMASALSEADGIDYTDPEELELLITTLIDLDAMDGKSSVSLLAECSSSPNVNTRQALANALAAAPSMWTLGNAGMGALQRLAEDKNPAIAVAASKAIFELKKQWEIEEGDSLRFMMNEKTEEVEDNQEDISTD
ncbi:senescence-associated family protein [Euphorbia peplus]|nr:senescence-associated family protein [Euphorbia peplus]